MHMRFIIGHFLLVVIFICSSFVLPTHSNAQTQEFPWDEWTETGPYTEWPFPFRRHEHAFVENQGKLYLIGGRGNKPVQIYDPETDLWEIGAEPPIEIHHMQLVSIGTKIYVLGAFTGNFPNETPVSSILIYETTNDTWNWSASIPENRRRGSAGVVVYQNEIYVISGIIDGHSSGWVTWVDKYNPSTGAWTILPDAPNARDHFHAALVDDKIVVAGGRRSGASGVFNATVGAVDVFDIGNNSWSTVNNIPTKRAGCSVATIGREVLVIGGESGTQFNAHDQVEAYHIDQNNWRTLDPLNQGRHGFQATKLGNKIYVAAGSIERGANELDYGEASYMEVYAFDPADDPDGGIDPPDPGPVANIQANPTSGNAPLVVQFDGSGSVNNGEGDLTYAWDFGDGNTGTGAIISHTYTAIGSFTAQLTVADNQGNQNFAQVNITTRDPNAKDVLLVAEMGGADQQILDRITSLGYNVTQVTAQNATLADAEGKSFIFISSTVNSNDLQGLYAETAVPIINCEPFLHDDLFMTGAQSGQDLDIVYNQSSLGMSGLVHPLSAGLSGTIEVIVPTTAMSWGKPAASAISIANVLGNPTQQMIFAYEEGANLFNSTTAPAKRLGFFFHDQTAANLTTDGWKLFDAAIYWITGTNPVNLQVQTSALEGRIPFDVNLDAGTSSHALGNELIFEWTLPDGTSQTGSTLNLTFEEMGTYSVSLLVGDNTGNSQSTSFDIVAEGGLPEAILEVLGDSSLVPARVQHDARSSVDLDGEIVRYIWDYGNGEVDTLDIDELPYDSLGNASLIIDTIFGVDTIVSIDTLPVDSIVMDTLVMDSIVSDTLANDSIVYDTITIEVIVFDTLVVDSIVFDSTFIPTTTLDTIGVDSTLYQELLNTMLDSLLAPERLYEQSGEFPIQLWVVDNEGLQAADQDTVLILNQAPMSEFQLAPLQGYAPLEVAWDISNSSDVDGSIVSYQINFGNGLGETILVDTTFSDSLLTGSTTYLMAGEWEATFIATDNLGASDTATATVQIINQAPTAVAMAVPDTAFAPVEIVLDGSTSSDIDGQIVSYSWLGSGDNVLSFDTVSSTSIQFDRWGTYVVALQVTDNLGATAMDVITIEIPNQAPSATIETNSTSGFAPYSLNLGANINDPDGEVLGIKWTHESAVIGDGTQLELVLDTPGVYTYVLTVTDDGGLTQSDTITIEVLPAPKDILFVVGEANLNNGDLAVKNRLEALGFNVIVKDDGLVQTSDAAEKSMVIVSSTSISSQVNTKFTQSTVPLLAWEAYLFDDLGMTGTVQGTDYQQLYNQSQLEMLDGSHPLGVGLAGITSVYTSPQVMSWGNPSSEAAKIATAANDPSKSLIFAYEEGAAMVNGAAPAKRLGFFLQDQGAANLTDAGWALFDAAICWLGNCSIPQNRFAAPSFSGEINLYPNPVKVGEKLYIEHTAGKNLEIKLFDLMGNLHGFKVSQGQEMRPFLKIPQISPGIYLIFLREKEKFWTKKIIIE